MPGVTQSFGSTFSMFGFDSRPTGTVLAQNATTFSYLTRDGSVVTLSGVGFTYGASVGPLTGTIAEVSVTPRDGEVDAFTIEGSFAVADLPDDFYGAGSVFWGALLGGNDTFDLAGASSTPSLFGAGSEIYGDGDRFIGLGAGGDDTMALDDAAGTFSGDIGALGSTSTPSDYTGGNDVITGTFGADRQSIVGDVVRVVWRDTLVGGGDVITHASPGTVWGDVYRQLYGGTLTGGNDVVRVLGTADRTVYGDAGELDDFGGPLTFVGGNDRLDARRAGGETTLFGDAGQMILSRANGEPGPQIQGGADLLLGGRGADAIVGDVGFVSVSVTVRFGNDAIYGYGGNDTIHGDYLDLGANTNRLLLSGGDDFIDGGAGADTIFGQLGDDRLFGGAGSDAISGGSGADRLFGEGGFDTLDGGRGDDALFGGDGNDILVGGDGADVLNGGAGVDVASYAASLSAVTLDMIDPTANRGDAAGDILVAVENAVGSGEADTLAGSDFANVLLGRAGDDRIDGRGGADALWGGAGADVLTGGQGFDTFGYRSFGEARVGRADVITDFDRRFDVIDLSLADADLTRPGNQAFTWIGQGAAFTGQAGELRYFVGTVQADVNGDARPDLVIRMENVPFMTADDFVL